MMNPEQTAELLSRLDERTAFLVDSNRRILDQMASKAELEAAIAPVVKDLAEHKISTRHEIEKIEHTQQREHQRLIWVTWALMGTAALALGIRQLSAWISALS
jgi:hypothetical protein